MVLYDTFEVKMKNKRIPSRNHNNSFLIQTNNVIFLGQQLLEII